MRAWRASLPDHREHSVLSSQRILSAGRGSAGRGLTASRTASDILCRSALSKLRQLKKAGAGAAHLSTVVPAHYDTRQHVARRVGRAELLKGQHAVPARVHVLLRDAVLLPEERRRCQAALHRERRDLEYAPLLVVVEPEKKPVHGANAISLDLPAEEDGTGRSAYCPKAIISR